MDFALTEEQQMIREMCRNFAEKEVAPLAEETDREHKYPAELVKRMGELGLMGVTVPEKWGGAGMDSVCYAIAVEEISRACGSTGVIMAVNNSLACWPLDEFGTSDQKDTFLRPMASGEKLGCFALTEANAGSDVANMSTTATLDKDGEWYTLSGSKLFISNAAEAEYCILFAYTDKSRGHKGMSAFVVNMKTPGIKVSKPERKLGIHGCSTCEIEFGDGAVVPKGNLLGEEGLGFKIALGTLNGGRISIAAQALGLAQGALDIALQFSKDRVQFGKPISNFQAVSFTLAQMATELAAARWLTWHAAWLKDQGEKHIMESAMAKAKAGEVSHFVCNKAVQILGGYGYTEDYRVERMFRDARITEIYEGTTEMQWMTISKMLLA